MVVCVAYWQWRRSETESLKGFTGVETKVPLWIWSALVARQRLTRAAFIHLSAHCVPPAMLALCRRRWRALDPPRWRL